jgi:hypothetical protein
MKMKVKGYNNKDNFIFDENEYVIDCKDEAIIDWKRIAVQYYLSEQFLQKYKDKLLWKTVIENQYLSEQLMREVDTYLDFNKICRYQRLSEEFIEDYQDKVNWLMLCTIQKLSESFIEKYYYKVSWYTIAIFQELSETFIQKHITLLPDEVVRYQKVSGEFLKRNKWYRPANNWLYKDTEYKKNRVVETGMYECYDDYFIAYKAIRKNRFSYFNFLYKYEKDGIYETHADYTTAENSFGFSAWTEKDVQNHCPELVIPVKIKYEDVARVLYNSGRIRCSKLEVLG